MSHRHSRSLSVGALARVEGEGGLHVRVEGDRVVDVRLQIYEPPRFFEAFLRGRGHTEPPDITARICGICPVAYQTSACLAIEDACGVVVDGPIADLRRLLYCGEWISSHALHIYLLHAPDFLGYPGVVEMARDHRAIVERGLALKKAGNAILELIGGRAIHPVNVRVGGFYRAPTRPELRELRSTLDRAVDDATATVDWVAGFDVPDFTHDHELLALVEPGRYAIESGTPRTDRGFAFDVRDVDTYVLEEHVPHSTALHGRLARPDRPPTARAGSTSPGRSPGTPCPVRGSPRPRERRRTGPGWEPCAATRSAASWCARSNCSTRPRRRGGWSRSTSRRSRPPFPCHPGPGPAPARPRRPGGRCSTGTFSTATGP